MASCKREMCSMPYTQAQLRALWSVACACDIQIGGNWDARVATLNYYSKAFCPWDGDGLPLLLCTLYFSWGTAPRLWAVERITQAPYALPWQVLGELERQAFGTPLHGLAREESPT